MVRFPKKFTVFNDFFSWHWQLSKFVGLRFDINDKRVDNKWFNILNFVAFLLFEIVQCLNVAAIVMHVFLRDMDIIDVLTAIPRTLVEVEVLTRCSFFYFNLRRIRNILKRLNEMYNIHTRTNSYLMRNSGIVYLTMTYFLGSATFYLMVSLCSSISLYLKTGVLTPLIHSKLIFPFGLSDYFLPVFLFHAVSFGSYVICVSSTEPTIVMILCHISHQFKNIAVELSEWDGRTDAKKFVERHSQLYRLVDFNMIQITERQYLMWLIFFRMCNDLNDMFRFPFLFIVLNITFVVCFVGFVMVN